MKTIDYINTLIKENEELTALCKSHVETIITLKRELKKLNTIIMVKDKKINKLENNSSNSINNDELENIKNQLEQFKQEYDELKSEYDNIILKTTVDKPQRGKSELTKLKAEYKKLQRMYEDAMLENAEYKRIFEDIESTCDSD